MDYSHSKWPEVFQMAQTTATHTIEVLRHCKIRSSTTAGLRQWITISFRRISSVCQRKRNSSHFLCPVPPLFKWTRGTSRAYIQAISADKCKGWILSRPTYCQLSPELSHNSSHNYRCHPSILIRRKRAEDKTGSTQTRHKP